MAGIYFHIPFCKKACIYCDFHFSTNTKYKGELVEAMLQELKERKNYLGNTPLQSVYFGGGTPSLLTEAELRAIMEHIHKLFRLSPDAEITLEANPDDLDKNKIKSLQRGGINRLSVGIQSFRDEDLRFMNRSHNVQQADYAVKQAQDVGLENISVDLIYAIPNLSNAAWQQNMLTAIALQVPHISAYSLTVEEKTVLHHKIAKGEIKEVKDAVAQKHFEMLELLQQAGYEHYEVSNLAKAGKQAVHNSNYWNGAAYLGVGPSAHSFNGKTRQWNVANNALYVNGVQQGKLNFEQENLSKKDQYNEYVMTHMRKQNGLAVADVNALFGTTFGDFLHQEAIPEREKGNLIEQNGRLYIPQSKRFFSDGIAASLFYL